MPRTKKIVTESLPETDVKQIKALLSTLVEYAKKSCIFPATTEYTR